MTDDFESNDKPKKPDDDLMFQDLTLEEDDNGKPSSGLGNAEDQNGESRAMANVRAMSQLQDEEGEGSGHPPMQSLVRRGMQKEGGSDLSVSAIHGSDISSDFGQTSGKAGMNVRKEGRIGDRLIREGLINDDQLNVAIQEQKISRKMLGEVLVDLGFIAEEDLIKSIANASGMEVYDPQTTIMDGEALEIIDKRTAFKHNILPLYIDALTLKVAMADPHDVVALDVLKQKAPKGVRIQPIMAAAKVLHEAIDAAFGYASSINAILKELETGSASADDLAGLKEEEAHSHPIVRLVNALIFDAVKQGASDLHFEPEENFIRLRNRVDGVLETVRTFHKKHWNGVSQRLKIMAHLNIADKLNPQDGRISMSISGRSVDFRVSSLPTVHGENIVLRVLDKSSSIMPLSALGFSSGNLEKIKRSQSKPEGIIIVTGPTGSGKTTSLYSMLNEINTVDVNIQTLEDPVEYALPMIRQTHVREGILDFADGIKALLRQDPDIIFIGEIRDATTANMAVKAAMTGHQVYTTLHTNDSFGAIPRLLDLDLKPGLLAGSIISVFAQRLARRLCEHCKEEHKLTGEEVDILKIENAASQEPVFKARQGGCSACGGTGYKGRIAVAEILEMDEDMDAILASGGNKAELKAEALKKGFKSMKDDGILKVKQGITDLQALSRVVDIH